MKVFTWGCRGTEQGKQDVTRLVFDIDYLTLTWIWVKSPHRFFSIIQGLQTDKD